MTGFPGHLPTLWKDRASYLECFDWFQAEAERVASLRFIFDPVGLSNSFSEWNIWAQGPPTEIVQLFHQRNELVAERGFELAGRVMRVFSTRINLRQLAKYLVTNRVIANLELTSTARRDKFASLLGIENEFFGLLFCGSFFWFYVAQFMNSDFDENISSKMLSDADFPRVVAVCHEIQSGKITIEKAFDTLIYQPI